MSGGSAGVPNWFCCLHAAIPPAARPPCPCEATLTLLLSKRLRGANSLMKHKPDAPAKLTPKGTLKRSPRSPAGPAAHVASTPRRGAMADGSMAVLETLLSYILPKQDLPLVRTLLQELDRCLDSEVFTQDGLRSLCVEKMESEISAGLGTAPLTKELAILGSYMAALIVTLGRTLGKIEHVEGDDTHDEHAISAFLIATLLRDCHRCFESMERVFSRDLGSQQFGKLFDALLLRSQGQNTPLLVAGHLASEIPQNKFTPLDHIQIKAFAAALVEAQVAVRGPRKLSRLKSAEAVAAALNKGGYELPGHRSRKIPPDTVKRWPDKYKRGGAKDFDGATTTLLFHSYVPFMLSEIKAGKTDFLLRWLTALCRKERILRARSPKPKT